MRDSEDFAGRLKFFEGMIADVLREGAEKLRTPTKPKRLAANESGELYRGCAVDVLRAFPKPIQLAFCDPPFNIGENYRGFSDKVHAFDHEALMYLVFAGIVERLVPDGLVAWHVPEKMVFGTLQAGRLVGLKLRRQIIRSFEFGTFQKGNWIQGAENLLTFAIGTPKWRPKSILVPSVRLGMGDKRVGSSEWKGYRPPSSVWPFARIQGNHSERWKQSPNQLPLKYLARLVLAHTDEGDTVFDGFCGTGGLWLVCQAAGRKYVGAELVDVTALSAVARVKDKAQQALAAAAVESVRKGEP